MSSVIKLEVANCCTGLGQTRLVKSDLGASVPITLFSLTCQYKPVLSLTITLFWGRVEQYHSTDVQYGVTFRNIFFSFPWKVAFIVFPSMASPTSATTAPETCLESQDTELDPGLLQSSNCIWTPSCSQFVSWWLHEWPKTGLLTFSNPFLWQTRMLLCLGWMKLPRGQGGLGVLKAHVVKTFSSCGGDIDFTGSIKRRDSLIRFLL